MVIGSEFSCKGAGGILAAGWWDNAWAFNPLISYVRSSLPYF